MDEVFYAVNTDTEEATDSWNTAVDWVKVGNTVMAHDSKLGYVWNAKPINWKGKNFTWSDFDKKIEKLKQRRSAK